MLYQDVSFLHPVFIHVSQDAKDLILRMLCRNVDLRISAREIFEHEWAKFFSENEQTFSGETIKDKKRITKQK